MDGKLPKTGITKKYQIVLVTAELGPYSKTGGLGEAMDGLSVALAALGHRVMVVTPRYDQYEDAWDTSFWSTVKMGGKDESVHFFHAYKQKVDQVFVDHPCFLANVWGKTGLSCMAHSSVRTMLTTRHASPTSAKLRWWPFDS